MSSMRSPASSRPTERRMVPDGCRRPQAWSDMRKWVVEAGWMTRDLASPTLARWGNARRLDEPAAARPPPG